jgi:RimJ/RimL family protein N-acetyltransferase
MNLTDDPAVDLVLLVPDALEGMLAGDLDRASAAAGVALPGWFLEEGWLWEIRLGQVRLDPSVEPWLPCAVVTGPGRHVAGHAGFHGPPDARGMVEIGYTIAPEYRRRGLGRAVARALVRHAATVPGVTVVRASISPENAASLALIRPLGFTQVGEQWDEEDGLELIFECPVR